MSFGNGSQKIQQSLHIFSGEREGRSGERVEGLSGTSVIGAEGVGQQDVVQVLLARGLTKVTERERERERTPEASSSLYQLSMPGDRQKSSKVGAEGAASNDKPTLTRLLAEKWHRFPPWTCQQ